MKKTKLAIFASGSGSNAMNLIQYFKSHSTIEVELILSNNKNAPIIAKAEAENVKTFCLTNAEVSDGTILNEFCQKNNIDWIILAGYLRLIPADFITHFDNKIINLHPSLLPKYGGKGMFGSHVHEAVIANKETNTGISIHYVNHDFDKGAIIAQFHCAVDANDTVDNVAAKIHQLEQSYLPVVIEKTILNSLV